MREMEERRYSKCRTRSACSHASDYFLELAVYSLFALSEVKEHTEGLPVLMLRWKVFVIEMTKERARLLSTVGDRQIVSARRADSGGRGLVDRHGALSAQMRQPGKPELPESPSTCRQLGIVAYLRLISTIYLNERAYTYPARCAPSYDTC